MLYILESESGEDDSEKRRYSPFVALSTIACWRKCGLVRMEVVCDLKTTELLLLLLLLAAVLAVVVGVIVVSIVIMIIMILMIILMVMV